MASPPETAQAPLRVVAAATFLPAFALCIAHGARSGRPVPAVGLVPLALSSGLSIFQLVRLRRHRQQNQKKKQQQAVARRPSQPPRDDEAAGAAQEAPAPALEQQGDGERGGEEDDDEWAQRPRSPVLVFFADAALAAALLVVLVFTWTQKGDSAELAMLAAYATIPLLVNL